jgi:hypothetical protein
VPRSSSRLERIASAAEVITGKPAEVHCDKDVYADVEKGKTHWRIGLRSASVRMEECEIHALGSLMHSPINYRDVSDQAGSLAGNLFAALEHNRIDRITSRWYDRDMVAASTKHINYISVGGDMLAQELLRMLYGKPLSGRFPILGRYRKDIEAAVVSSSPVKALKTAVAMAREVQEGTSEPVPEYQRKPSTPEKSREQETPRKIDDYEYADVLINLGGEAKAILQGSGNHQYRVLNPEMVPFPGMEYCGYILNQWAGSKPLYKAAVRGVPRNNVWAINYGRTKVFNKRIVSAGKVVVLVDLSSSMEGFWSVKQPGYLAFQAANLIAGSSAGSDVDLYGFTGTFDENVIVPLKAGYVPQDTEMFSSHCSQIRLTPMCVALKFLSSVYQGAEASIAVLITDGDPSAACSLSQDHVLKHTRELAYSLYEAGIRYFLIQVNIEGLEHLYPADITLHVSCEGDLLQIPLGMSSMIG